VPHIRVADFGIAKVAGAMGNVTKHGTFVGTPEYAAPEQFEGMDPTPATDVFAAGALFVHLLTGRMPIMFSTRTDIKTCREEWLAALPPRLDPLELKDAKAVELVVLQEILDHMMDVRPERRWTIQQVLSRLEGLVAGNAELRQRETLELTGRPAPSRNTQPGPLAEPTAAAFLDEDGYPVEDEGEEEPTGRHSDPLVPEEISRPVTATAIPVGTESGDGPEPTDPQPADPTEPESPPGVSEALVAAFEPPPPEPPTLEALAEELDGPAEGRGLGGCFAALAGLGVAGGGVLAVGAVLVVVVLAGAAWQLGYFQSGPRTVVLNAPRPGPGPGPTPTPVPGDPVPANPVPGDPVPGDPVPANPVPGDPMPTNPVPGDPVPANPVPAGGDPGVRIPPGTAPWRAVRDAFDARRADVVECGATGVVIGTAWITGGAVETVRLDPGYLSGDPAGCVEGALEGAAVPDAEGWVRFGI
jgi:hypothetical protein